MALRAVIADLLPEFQAVKERDHHRQSAALIAKAIMIARIVSFTILNLIFPVAPHTSYVNIAGPACFSSHFPVCRVNSIRPFLLIINRNLYLFRTFTPTRKNSFQIGRIHSFHIQIRQDI